MIPRKTSVITPSLLPPSSYVQAARLKKGPISSHSYISSFCSLLLDMQIYSPSIKVVKHPGPGTSHSYPVFGDQDTIEGKVMLDPSCPRTGRLTITLEGAFEYASVKDNQDNGHPCKPIAVRKQRHVFLSSSVVIPISSPPEPRSTIREVLGVRKRPSASSLNSPVRRSCEFSFELPRGSRPDEGMPSTFSNKTPGNQRGQLHMEEFEVAYRVTAIWEASDGSENKAILEAPVLFQPEADFQSIDGSAVEIEPWLEMPLIPDRPIPFNCAVTLPHYQSFSRCSSIPYFVVFSTNARSSSLIKEIAADATIAVFLTRTITIPPQRTIQSPVLPDSPLLSDESDGQVSPFISRSKIFKRSLRTPTRSQESFLVNKPLPELPQQGFCTSQTLLTQISIGFPKRPWVNDSSQSVPDGLYKGKLQLSKGMLPSMDWHGINVKYYLDVSVLFGQDDVRARVPILVY